MKLENIEDIYPLSPTQQGILFHSLYAPESGVYLMQLSCVLHGNLNVLIFEQAWQEVVNRHPALRTAFYWEDLEQPLQVVHPQVEFSIEKYDWRDATTVEQKERLEEFLKQERDRNFDLSVAPLMRVALIQVSFDTYQFVWSKHHLIVDGWSTALILQQVLEIYRTLSNGQAPVASRSRPYGDYIAWLQQQDLKRAEAFWRELLQGVRAIAPLPSPTSPRSQVQPGNDLIEAPPRNEREMKLSTETTATLQSFARQHHLTLNALVQGAWAILLSRYTGELDVVFGATCSGRPPTLAGADSMVGLFINTLPVRVRISSEESCIKWLQQLQYQQIQTRQYEYTPLVEIQGWSEIPRNLPLFESIVVFENYPVSSSLLQQDSNLEIRDVRFVDETNYSLTLIAVPGEELSLRIVGASQRFDTATITRMLGHLQTLLEGIVANPVRSLKDLPILTEVERNQLLVEWNQTQIEYPIDKCLHQLFEEQVERSPDAIAVVFEGQKLTYRELNYRADVIAKHLELLGVKPDVLVGICVERSLFMIIGLLGILKAGGAYVPLDPEYPKERLTFILNDAAVPVLLTQQHLLPELGEHNAKVVFIDDLENQNWQLPVTFHPSPNSANLAYVIYTSGSTGKPKGVQIPHRAVVNFLNSMRLTLDLTQQDVFLSVTTITFDIAALEIFGTLTVGACLTLVSRAVATDGTQLLAKLADSNATVMQATPATWRLLLAAGWQGYQPLKMLCGGEALSSDLASKLLKRGTSLWNLYGPTETTIWSTAYKVESDDNSIAIGRPIANTQIYILDSDLQPVPIGIPGELYIGGVGLANGYVNRPDLTGEKFIPNPFLNSYSERLYKTGDLARYRSDGNIEYLGRIDYQVKIRGFRIELGEIEAVLAQHEAVREAVVLAREDEPGNKRLVAYVTSISPSPSVAVSPSILRGFLQKKLPDYMVPSAFVLLEVMPLLPNGKLDRKALPKPELTRPEMAETFVPAATFVESAIASIFAQVLGLETVGIRDNFFELGGHSLLATQVISQLRQTFKIELPLRYLFESPTVAALAEQIELAMRSNQGIVQPIERVSRNADLPLSFAQMRLWFLDKLEPGAVYNIPAAVRLVGALDVAVLEECLNEIVRRHEVLRTIFLEVEGQPVQRILPMQTINLRLINLRELPESEREPKVRELAVLAAKQPFALDKDPLLRVSLFQLSDEEWVILFSLHHIIGDAWSMEVLLREVATLYAAFSSQKRSPLPELPIQYADFAVWQRQQLQPQLLETQMVYWRQQLEQVTVLELPTDYPRKPQQTFIGKKQSLRISEAIASQLKSLSSEQGCTLFMTLLAAFKTLLHRYTGQDDIPVGSPIANGRRAETNSLIGFFVNTLVLRTDLSGNPTFRELLSRVREVALGAYSHQDLPFEKLVEELQPQRNLSHPPLFQVMFVFQNAPLLPVEIPNFTWSDFAIDTETAKFDLTLYIEDKGREIVSTFEYNTSLFDAATINRMLGHFSTLLESIVADADKRLSDLTILTEIERHFINGNDTEQEFPREQCIHELFAAQVERSPAAIAVICEQRQLTYRELNEQANQLAKYLQKLGVKPEVKVGICVERSLEMVVGILAILKAGGAYVPLDPAYPKERLAFVLEDAQVSVLLTQKHLLEILPANNALLVLLDEESREEYSIVNDPCPMPNAQSLAYVIYTSGSTGKPKGVAIEHRSTVELLYWAASVFTSEDLAGVLASTSLCFDLSVFELFVPLSWGGTVILAENALHLPTLKTAEKVTLINTVPSAIRELLKNDGIPTSVRTVNLAGEALPNVLVQQLYQRQHIQRVFNLYGPSEDTTYSSFALIKKDAEGTPPIGRAIANTKIYLLDRYLQPVPIGVPGEIYISSTSLARGYLNRPDLTAEKFIPNPFARSPLAPLNKGGNKPPLPIEAGNKPPLPIKPLLARGVGGIGSAPIQPPLARGVGGIGSAPIQPPLARGVGGIGSAPIQPPLARGVGGIGSYTRLYKTGDLAKYLPNGDIEYLGRIDNQIKIRGFRIELGEIEAVLNQHPAVREAVVIAREDKPDNKRLVAYIVSVSPTLLNCSILRSFLKEKLPEYMIPGAFVMLDALPLTLNGKVDRRALPTPEKAEQAEGFVTPRTPVEAILAKIWVEVLGVKQVGIHDNFFQLGGDSILNIQIVARANQAGLKLTPKQLFQHQTIAELATVAGTTGAIAAEQGIITGVVPLTPIQHWFFEQNLAEPHHFNQAILLEVRQEIDPTLIEKAVQELALHHDALRLRFEKTESSWQQFFASPDAVPFTRLDFSQLPESDQELAAQKAANELQSSLNLSTGPIWRVALLEFGMQQPPRLLFAIHHLAVDGISWRILLEDLPTAIQQINQGEKVRLPAKTTSFKQWSEQLQRYAQSAALQQELNYWLSELQQEANSLPVDYPGGDNSEAAADTVAIALTIEETQALLQQVPKAYNTQINDVLLTALVQAFAQWTNNKTLLVDLEGHGREEIFDNVDLSRTIGWFTTVFPVRINISEAADLEQALQVVKKQVRAIPNRGIGYGVLRYLANNEMLAKLPQAEVCFNYLGQFDQTLKQSFLFGAATGSRGEVRSPKNQRRYLLEINGFVSEGQLTMSWTYSQNLHQRTAIENLAESFRVVLRSLILNVKTLLPGKPLSFAQQRLWFLEQLEPGNPAFNIPVALRLRGVLNVTALEESLNEIVKRHEILRTSFNSLSGKPFQAIAPSLRLTIPVLDGRETEVQRLIATELEQPFDIAKAPLLRATLRRLSETEYVFIFVIHHLISDNWSMGIFLQELATLYEAFSKGEQSPLPELPIQYADFAVLQREQLQEKLLETQLAYWKQQLEGATFNLALPTDKPRPALTSFRGATHAFVLPKSLVQALKTLSQQKGCTLFMVLLAAFNILLYGYTKQTDILVGSPIANRHRIETEKLIGLFINTLVFRTKLTENLSFLDVLHQVREVTLGAYAHQDLPFEKLVEELQPNRNLRNTPIFQVWFAFQNTPTPAIALSDITTTTLKIDSKTAQFDLALLLAETSEGMRGFFEYKTDLFEDSTLHRMAGKLAKILERIVAQPDLKLNELVEILAQLEREQQLTAAKELEAANLQSLKNIKRKRIGL